MPGLDDNSFAAHFRQFVLMISLSMAFVNLIFICSFVFPGFFFNLDLTGSANYARKLPISTVKRPNFKPGLTLTLNSVAHFLFYSCLFRKYTVFAIPVFWVGGRVGTSREYFGETF